MNVLQSKLDALETFYGWVDYANNQFIVADYNIAVGQTFAYEYSALNELEKLIWVFTILSRFERSAKIISKGFCEKVKTAMESYQNIDMGKYQLSDIEKEMLESDYKIAVAYMEWFNKKIHNI